MRTRGRQRGQASSARGLGAEAAPFCCADVWLVSQVITDASFITMRGVWWRWKLHVGIDLWGGEIGAGERETLETDGRPSLFGQLAYIAFTLVLSLTGGKSTPYNTSWHGPTAP